MIEYICLCKTAWTQEMVDKYKDTIEFEYKKNDISLIDEEDAFVIKLADLPEDCPRRVIYFEDKIAMIVKEDPELDSL